MIAYTISQNGNEITLNCSNGNSITTQDWNEAIPFLLHPTDFAIVYGLDNFVDTITNLLDKKLKDNVMEGGRIVIENRLIYYLQGKMFGVNYINFYGVSRYASEPIKNVAELYELGVKVLNAYKKMGLNPDKLTSPIAIFSDHLSQIPFPRAGDLPETAFSLISNCSKVMTREWRDTYKLGHWNAGEISDLDLGCYSQDTEALTINGWKLIKDLIVGELILGFNKELNRCEFQPIKNMTISPYQGQMINIKSSKIDLFITPNHRVLFKNKIRNKTCKEFKDSGHVAMKEWETREAKDVPNGNIRLPISFPMVDKPDYDVSDNMLRIIAWINTEGHAMYSYSHKINAVGISQGESSQTNKQYCTEILEILQSLQLNYSESIHHRIYKHEIPLVKNAIYVEHHLLQTNHSFRIKASSFNELPLDTDNIHYIPLWILQNCSLRQLRIYYDTLMKGDGSRRYNNNFKLIHSSFYTNLLINADRMQYLCHLLGYKINYIPPNKSHSTYSLSITEDRGTKFLGEKGAINYEQDLQFGMGGKTIECYDGIVSCPTIDDSYLVIRRNGKSSICGNSAYPSIVADLPDLSNATFFSSPTLPQTYSWGELQGALTITKPISPFFNEKINGFPIGTWKDSITTDELWLINKFQLGKFEMERGDFFTLPEKYDFPFKKTMENLYKYRSNPDEIVQKISKGISVGIWGKFAERYENRLGDNYQSIYARITTSRCLVKVAAFVYFQNLQERLVSVTVDGILIEGKSNISTEKHFGQWRQNLPDNALVLSQLYQWTGDKKPNGQHYKEIMETIQSKPNSSVFGDVDFRLIEYSRKFMKLPKNGKDLISNKFTSEPITIS